jgi:hypothetical protein
VEDWLERYRNGEVGWKLVQKIPRDMWLGYIIG